MMKNQTSVRPEEDLHPAGLEAPCPLCGRREVNHLGDGRLQCKRCRVKFTPFPKPGRLPDDTVAALADHFWQMTPIGRASDEMGLNRKTIHRYYTLFRHTIGERLSPADPPPVREAPGPTVVFVGELSSRRDGLKVRDTVSVFGVAAEGEKVRLVFPHHIEDWSGLNLPSLRPMLRGNEKHAPSQMEAGRQAEGFWSFARGGLGRYRGGFLKRLPLFMREMEFRYNHRSDPEATRKLVDLLSASPH